VIPRDVYEMARNLAPGLARAPWDDVDATEEELDAADAREALMAAEDEAAANDADPSDAALASDESISAVLDARTADFLDDLAGMVEQPEQFAVCGVAA